MARVLLDTHTYLWMSQDSPELSRAARQTLRLTSTEAFVSVVNFWEIAMKHARRGLKLKGPFERLLYEEVEENGYTILPLNREHIEAYHRLPFPSNGHADPFDQMLVAQALSEDLELLSADAKLDAYGVRRTW